MSVTLFVVKSLPATLSGLPERFKVSDPLHDRSSNHLAYLTENSVNPRISAVLAHYYQDGGSTLVTESDVTFLGSDNVNDYYAI